MKKMKPFKVALLLVGASFFACQSEKDEQLETAVVSDVAPEIISRLANFDVNTSDVKKVNFVLPNGSTTPMIQMEGDIHMPEDQAASLPNLQGLTGRNYHTNNLVAQNTVIDIIGFTGGGGFGLASNEQTALQWAVNNYNRLNLSIRFNLTFGTDYEPKDMVVYHNPNQNGAGGSAGFPSGGAPFKFVQIYGLRNYNTNVIEHVITHEIGHSVGFRHTDYFSRQSCGQNVNEGTAGVGANPIPGTPSGYDPTSIMLACFSNNEDGEFNNNDITALNYLY
ncbi:M57 family metalloprotease [Tenacibaculum sp. M341]|uniref:M57 family metalloprotease n=1 Tax=Tenacibaculum sp. M341 TaxID=2530339 RepID=UPI001051023B|nr:M57 family metalloprotease [Tenacibaculum sp. M341]TCI85570.1 peptidase [Tenacibaculum sp. M341]